ncbi:MAG: hypothetical protein AMXMBFR47_20710 [Planctomycetota bacterium]
MSVEYRVQLDVFSGPLDLLLFLLKRDELDIQDIPIVRVTDQYLQYVRLLEQVDPNAAGDFLVMASTLIEMKSRALLPSPPLDGDNEEEEARIALVRQLLEYKRFKDAARALGHAADDRAKRYVRRPAELPDELRGVELEEVEVWDLLTAFGRMMTSIGHGPGLHQVRYDDRPIEEYAQEIVETLSRRRTYTFQALFETRTTRAEIIGLFLALLELIRRRRVRAEQEKAFGVIYLFALDEIDEPFESPQPEPSPIDTAEEVGPHAAPAVEANAWADDPGPAPAFEDPQRTPATPSRFEPDSPSVGDDARDAAPGEAPHGQP